jgi:hypothetical protein
VSFRVRGNHVAQLEQDNNYQKVEVFESRKSREFAGSVGWNESYGGKKRWRSEATSLRWSM